MERLSDEIRGYAVIHTVGVEPTKLLDKCASEKVDFWGAYPEDEFAVTFCTRLSQAGRALDFGERCGCETQLIGRYGAPILLKRLKKRYLVWVMPVLLLALLFTAAFYIWKIDITGNETVSDIEILNALEDSGVYLGSFWPRFNSDGIRSQVLLKIPELKWISVSVFGSRALIEVRERTDIPALYDKDEPIKIVAAQPGIIEQMSVLQGFAKYKNGQTAAENDTLIDGAVPSTFAKTEIIHAEGSVLARTWYEISAILPMQRDQKTYTGKTHSCYAVIFGKTRINFYAGSSIFGAGCDNIIKKDSLGIPGLFTLPITLVSERSREYETAPSDTDAAEAKARLEALLTDELNRRLGQTGQTVTCEYTFDVISGFAVGTLRAECRQDIAEEQKMSQEEINAALSAGEEISSR